jgi:adenylate cyclase
MPLDPETSFVSRLLRNHFILLAVFVILLVWVALALSTYPWRDPDGSFASHPYGLLTSAENQALDLLFQMRSATRPSSSVRGQSEPITIIEIDEPSIKQSGVRLQKWPRDWYAKLIDRASQGGATVIGLDAFLSEQGGVTPEDKIADKKLADSIANAGNVVLARKSAAGGYDEINPLPYFSDGAYTVGFVDLPLDPDGFVRASQLFHAEQGKETQFSFATRLAEGHLGALSADGSTPQYLQLGQDGQVHFGSRIIPTRTDLNLQLDYRDRSPAFQRVSAGEILFNNNSTIPDSLFKDRIVLIGASNIDAPDLFPTPFYESMALPRLFDRRIPNVPKRTPGVEIHATSAATLLYGTPPVRLGFRLQTGLLLLLLSLAGLATFLLRPLVGFLAVVLLGILTLSISIWTFNSQESLLPLASSLLGFVILTPLGLGLRYARERLLRSDTEAEREQVMEIFSRFVSGDVAATIWERRGHLSLSGERRTVTVIFTDIRNFTTLSESVSSEIVVEWLNDYFGRMQTIVAAHGGHINKFIGDGLMIVFGAPIERGDQLEAKSAVKCGLAMLAEVEKMNEDWIDTGRPVIKIGVGIHTGEATCGVVGSEQRLEYTLIGDTVNLASRLESTTKELGVPILVSETTATYLDDEYILEPLGEVKVKGKTMNTKVFTISSKSAVSEQVTSAGRLS